MSIATLFFLLVLAAKYSVIPKYFSFKKFFLEIGPLIKPKKSSFFNNCKAIEKHFVK